MSNKTENATKNNFIIKGIVLSATHGTKTIKGNKLKEANRITVKSEEIPYDDITAFKDSGNKMTPSWYKERKGFINLASTFDIPVKNADGEKITFLDWLDTGLCVGSTVKVSFNAKDGAVYPKAIVVLEDGEPFNPFEGME